MKLSVKEMDLTQRLQDSEERYRLLFEDSPYPKYIYDNETLAFLAVNEAAIRHYGYSREEFMRMTLKDIRPPEEVATLLTHLNDMPPNGFVGTWLHRRKDGHCIEVELTVHAYVFKGRKARLVSAKDVTEMRKAESDLKKSGDRLKKSQVNLTHAQRIAHLGSWELELSALEDPTQNPLYWSEEVFRIFGLAPDSVKVTNDLFFEKVHPEDREKVRVAMSQALEQKKTYSIEHRILRPDGEERDVQEQAEIIFDKNGHALRLVGTILDITERTQLEEQLRQSHKMESVGRLAGGVAHDFNNILTIVKGYVDLLLPRFPQDDQTRRDIVEIQKATDQATALTRQLLAFSRKQVLQFSVFQPNKIITNIEKMLRRVIGEDIELILHLDGSLGNIRADPGQLEQILMNLSVNARDAMPGGGQLTIETAQAEGVSHEGGTHAMLCVRDNGCGMDPAVQAHLFEPFFTTKAQGKGTGLGLATVYGIVQQSGGTIDVDSVPGKGTAFRIYFPIVREAVEKIAAAVTAPSVEGGTETILIVEDESHIRTLLRRVLSQKGYTLLEASQGEEALALCKKYKAIDLIITDMVMPQMGGEKLVEALRKTGTNVKILFMSGYTGAAAMEHGLLKDGSTYLQKPFDVNTLISTVRQSLDT